MDHKPTQDRFGAPADQPHPGSEDSASYDRVAKRDHGQTSPAHGRDVLNWPELAALMERLGAPLSKSARYVQITIPIDDAALITVEQVGTDAGR